MDVLIKNIELPKDDEHGFILVFTKGLVVDFTSCKVIKAIELPPHGKLRDENDLVRLIEDNYGCGVCKNKADEERCLDRCKWAVLLNDIDSLPTIVEASNG